MTKFGIKEYFEHFFSNFEKKNEYSKNRDLELFGLKVKRNKLLAIFGYSNQQLVNIFFSENWLRLSVSKLKMLFFQLKERSNATPFLNKISSDFPQKLRPFLNTSRQKSLRQNFFLYFNNVITIIRQLLCVRSFS